MALEMSPRKCHALTACAGHPVAAGRAWWLAQARCASTGATARRNRVKPSRGEHCQQRGYAGLLWT